MQTRTAVVLAAIGVASGGAASRRASLVHSGIRRGQARQDDRRGHEVRVDQSARLVYIDTKDQTGAVANWGFRLAAASGLMPVRLDAIDS